MFPDKRFEPLEYLYSEDMDRLGDLFEYAGNTLRVDMCKFVKDFMCSNVRKEMENWHPWFSNEADTCLYNHFIRYCAPTIVYDHTTQYNDNELFWIGSAYGYMHYRTSLPSIKLYELLDFKTMRRLYITGHERGWESFALLLIKYSD